ncbi:MAG TPA: hypothetical protein VK302_03380 [Terriglobales bacterium]|nr:hypothetical protein [Terriglobales bacterium]
MQYREQDLRVAVVQVRTRKEVGADHPQTTARFVLPSISAAVSLDADLASIAPRVQPVPLHFSAYRPWVIKFSLESSSE